jgi:hypothetical protein
MVTIVWNPTGFYLIVRLQKGMKFNTDYYISEILTPLVQWQANQIGSTDRRLIAYANNARLHTAKKVTGFFDNNGLRMAPHPPYSLDLAPCDFFLFGSIKENSKAYHLIMEINFAGN